MTKCRPEVFEKSSDMIRKIDNSEWTSRFEGMMGSRRKSETLGNDKTVFKEISSVHSGVGQINESKPSEWCFVWLVKKTSLIKQ